MNHGAVIFALNNTDIDYIKLAVFAAKRVNHYLDLPVTLITDNKNWLEKHFSDYKFDKVIEIVNEPFSTRILYDGEFSSKTIDWKNTTRYQAFDLSPYDKTLVIDSDFIVSSSILKNAFTNNYDFQIYKNSFDLCNWRNEDEFKRLNQYSIPFYWATAFVFEKNKFTEAFFILVNYIKNNYKYFKLLYSINPRSPVFRNDYAFSIAINIMNGKTKGEFAVDLPGKMIYTKDKDILVDIKNEKLNFLIQKEDRRGEYILSKTEGLDVHVMNKLSLIRFLNGEDVV